MEEAVKPGPPAQCYRNDPHKPHWRWVFGDFRECPGIKDARLEEVA